MKKITYTTLDERERITNEEQQKGLFLIEDAIYQEVVGYTDVETKIDEETGETIVVKSSEPIYEKRRYLIFDDKPLKPSIEERVSNLEVLVEKIRQKVGLTV